MPDRVTDDSVPTVVGTLARAGGTRRREIQLPADAADDFPAGDVVRLVLDGTEYRTQLARLPGGEPAIRGAYETPSLARDPGSADNHLATWVDAKHLEAGRSVHVDVVEAGFKYGVRAPGESASYDAFEPPSEGLADIARSLDES
ncbi:DUF7112 family protein [Halobacterium wangiae]|uniref:DUF7112 family protein n=1 Tax=Halobacterium wangiae TaxID=2902623 RepID=UPI001E5D5C23|nr:hypothetical protein [Halobacterium wangiae]